MDELGKRRERKNEETRWERFWNWVEMVKAVMDADPTKEEEWEQGTGLPTHRNYRPPHRYRRLAEVGAAQEDALRDMVHELGVSDMVVWEPTTQRWHDGEYAEDGHLIFHECTYCVPVHYQTARLLTAEDIKRMAKEEHGAVLVLLPNQEENQ